MKKNHDCGTQSTKLVIRKQPPLWFLMTCRWSTSNRISHFSWEITSGQVSQLLHAMDDWTLERNVTCPHLDSGAVVPQCAGDRMVPDGHDECVSRS